MYLRVRFTVILNDKQVLKLHFRCVDEISLTAQPINRRQITKKLLRFVQAAKANALPHGVLHKPDVIRIKQSALFQHGIYQLCEPFYGRLQEQKLNQNGNGNGQRADDEFDKEAVLKYRALHTAICGPILTPTTVAEWNLI